MQSMERWQEAEQANAFLMITGRLGRQEPLTPLVVTSRMHVSRANVAVKSSEVALAEAIVADGETGGGPLS